MALAAVLALAGCSRAEPAPLDRSLAAVRLGMAPRDVRDRFAPDCPGAWVASTDVAGDDIVLDWKGSDGARIADARFEFHLGMLVAVREHVHHRSAGPNAAEATARAVARRSSASRWAA